MRCAACAATSAPAAVSSTAFVAVPSSVRSAANADTMAFHS